MSEADDWAPAGPASAQHSAANVRIRNTCIMEHCPVMALKRSNLSARPVEIVTATCGDASITRTDAEVEGCNAAEIRRALQRFRVAQRAHCVVVAGLPVVLHAGSGKLVVLGLLFVVLGPVDQMHDAVDLAIAERAQESAGLVVEPFGRHFFERF